MLKEDAVMNGWLRVELRDEFGNLKDIQEGPNVFTTVGKEHVADQLASSSDEDPMSHMAVGSGTTAAAAGNTALVHEVDRNALTSRTQGAGGDANDVIYIGDWGAGDATAPLTEAGIFNSSSVGTMLVRQTFAEINKGASDTLSITWTVTVG